MTGKAGLKKDSCPLIFSWCSQPEMVVMEKICPQNGLIYICNYKGPLEVSSKVFAGQDRCHFSFDCNWCPIGIS